MMWIFIMLLSVPISIHRWILSRFSSTTAKVADDLQFSIVVIDISSFLYTRHILHAFESFISSRLSFSPKTSDLTQLFLLVSNHNSLFSRLFTLSQGEKWRQRTLWSLHARSGVYSGFVRIIMPLLLCFEYLVRLSLTPILFVASNSMVVVC